MSVHLVNVRLIGDDGEIVHVVAPDEASRDRLVSDVLREIAYPDDIAIAVVEDDWKCTDHRHLRCGMPRLN